MACCDHSLYRKILTGAMIAALLSMWVVTAAASEVAIILVSDLNVRSSPDAGQIVLFRLAKQTRVRVLAHRGDWLKIDYNGHQGFILGTPDLVSIETIAEGPETQVLASADDPAPHIRDDLHRRAETLQEKLKTSQHQLQETNHKEHNILDKIDTVEQALDNARGQVRQCRAELNDLQARSAATQQRYDSLEKEIRADEAYADQRLVALYKLNWLGRIHLLATAQSFYDFIDRKSALQFILAHDDALLEKLRNDQIALASLLQQLNASKAEKLAAQTALNRRIKQLAAERAKRNALLDSVRSQKELEQAALEALQEAAGKLDKAIGSLEPVSLPARPATPNELFEASKGLLGWPVRGKIISFFGPYRDEKSNIVNFRSGINIQAERGEPVRAVSEGNTIYANWFKGFGNMMIIDHGDHYYTVYAHLEEVFKAKGDHVEKGEVIATVGDSGSLIGPALHFEVRHRGKPVDPLQWLNRG
jgi:septal ring factor EnvC (AmiA/AmiB activator)